MGGSNSAVPGLFLSLYACRNRGPLKVIGQQRCVGWLGAFMVALRGRNVCAVVGV